MRHGFPQYGKSFVFGIDEAEIVRGVTMQKIVVADDMETGRFEFSDVR